MKRGTPRHPKVAGLSVRLKLKKWGAVGLLEMLWHFTAEFAHAGDIGRFNNDEIAQALCWDGDSSVLVSSLVLAGWLDECACHRLRVHDWPDHADQTVSRVLAKRNQRFLECYDGASICLAKTSQPSPSPSPSPSPPPSQHRPSGASLKVSGAGEFPKTESSGGHQKLNGAQIVVHREEFNRVTEELKRIKDETPEDVWGRCYKPEQKARIKKLKDRKEELKEMLGVVA